MKTKVQKKSRSYLKSSSRVAIVVARFNSDITEGLLQGAVRGLVELGVKKSQIDIYWVPGCFEIPVIALKVGKSKKCVGVIALGTVIRGDTAHFDYVCQGTTMGVMQAGLTLQKPVLFGVLTTDNKQQAQVRSANDDYNKGYEAAHALIETLNVFRLSPSSI